MNSTLALERFERLTAIEGISGQEADVATAIIDLLRQAGVSDDQISIDDAAERTDPNGNHGNIIVSLPGDSSKPRTMLSAHMDTVPICVGSVPVRVDDQYHSESEATGLGADDRAGCAAILTAVCERLAKPGDHPPAVITFLVQEEIGLRGARHLDADRLGKVDRAFNFDGGSPDKMTIGAIGGQRMTIEISGTPAHAGVAPTEGVSAIVIAGLAIASLHRDGWLGRVEKDGRVGTANVGVIRGGDATNVITPHVHLRAEARSHDGSFRTEIVAAIRDAFESAASSVRNDAGRTGEIRFESQVDYEAFALPEDHPSVLAAASAIEAVGRMPQTQIGNGGLDANWLYRHGVEAVTLGCGQRNIHTADERLDIADYLDACRIATAMITDQS